MHGRATGYHQNGNIAMIGHFVGDSLHGYAALYYDSGIMNYEGNFNMGTMEGKWTTYMLDGDILAEYIYEIGEIISIKD